MNLNISKMEQFSKMQIECLEMMQGLIAYDKEESAKGTITPTNTKLVEAFIDTQKKALQAFTDLLEKHKPCSAGNSKRKSQKGRSGTQGKRKGKKSYKRGR